MKYLLLETFYNILFIIQLLYVFLTEYLYFNLGVKNYNDCIDSVACNLTKINILYVKLFQAIALNNNYIDEETNKILIKYTDNVPYNGYDINWSDLIDCKEDFKIKMDTFIPINSGMISVVFKCMKDGKPVIMKMKRYNIEKKMDYAIGRLKFCVNILSLIPLFNSLEIPNLINKNIDIIMQQTNFIQEISNILLFKQKFQYVKYIKIPDVYENVTFCYPNIICMEYIEGMNIKNIDTNDMDEYAKLMIKFGFTSVFNFGLAHGDLHSGNVLFIKNEDTTNNLPKYQLGIIDLGIILRLDQETKNSFIDIFSDITNQNTRKTSIKIINNLLEPKYVLRKINKTQKENIITIISDALDKIIKNKNANQSMIYKNIKKLNDYLNMNPEIKKIGMKPSDEFVKLQFALAMSHGVTLELCKEKYVELTNTVLDELFHRNLLN